MAKLGFDIADVKVRLNSHAHSDHAPESEVVTAMLPEGSLPGIGGLVRGYHARADLRRAGGEACGASV